MVFETAKLLKSRGYDPLLLHFGSPYVNKFADENDIEQHIIPNYKYYKKILLLPLFVIKTSFFITKLKLDCLHAHLYGPIIAFAPIAWMLKLPYVGTLHDVYMIEEAPNRIWLLKLAAILKTQLVAVSKPMQEFYREAINYKTNKIAYVPNCTNRNNEKEGRETVRRQLDLHENDIAVVSVGRLVSLKRFDVLIEAISMVRHRENIYAFIVGAGPERSQLELLVDKLDVRNNVKFLGERNDVAMLLAATDIFTLTSETEGMSKSILEALSAGLPIIATDVGGNKDLVAHKKNGYLLNNHSPAALADYLEQLANNDELRATMGISSQALVTKEYNPELFLERHINIYKKTISNY